MSVRRKRWFSLKSERSADVQRLVAMIGCALYACRSFFCATFERMPGSDTVENAALIAELSKVRGTFIPSILMHSASTPWSGMSQSFIAASTVSSPMSLASVSPSMPARSESAASSVFSVMPDFFTTTAGAEVVGCLARYAFSTSSFTRLLSQPSAIAFASMSANSPPQTPLIIATRSRSALIASAAIAFASGAGSWAGAAAATTVLGVSEGCAAGADAVTGLGASAGAAGAAAGAAGVVGAAGVPVPCPPFPVPLMEGSIMEFPFSSSLAVTVMCVERSAPTATTLTSRKVDLVTW